jgi:hypothetical protein
VAAITRKISIGITVPIMFDAFTTPKRRRKITGVDSKEFRFGMFWFIFGLLVLASSYHLNSMGADDTGFTAMMLVSIIPLLFGIVSIYDSLIFESKGPLPVPWEGDHWRFHSNNVYVIMGLFCIGMGLLASWYGSSKVFDLYGDRGICFFGFTAGVPFIAAAIFFREGKKRLSFWRALFYGYRIKDLDKKGNYVPWAKTDLHLVGDIVFEILRKIDPRIDSVGPDYYPKVRSSPDYIAFRYFVIRDNDDKEVWIATVPQYLYTEEKDVENTYAGTWVDIYQKGISQSPITRRIKDDITDSFKKRYEDLERAQSVDF